jgi:hypothetical protein
MRAFIIFLIFIIFPAIGNELVILQEPPVGIKQLKTEIITHSAPKRISSNGTLEFCYVADSYVIYSKNLLGYGYQISKAKPNNFNCVIPQAKIESGNKLGLYVGMLKHDVEAALGNIELNNVQTIIWQTELLKNSVSFDVQTFAEIKFKNNKLVWLSVFTTITN